MWVDQINCNLGSGFVKIKDTIVKYGWLAATEIPTHSLNPKKSLQIIVFPQPHLVKLLHHQWPDIVVLKTFYASGFTSVFPLLCLDNIHDNISDWLTKRSWCKYSGHTGHNMLWNRVISEGWRVENVGNSWDDDDEEPSLVAAASVKVMPCSGWFFLIRTKYSAAVVRSDQVYMLQ